MTGITVELFLNVFNEFSKFHDKKHLSLKGLKSATFCARDWSTTAASKTHVRDKIFKFGLIHASVIYHIP